MTARKIKIDFTLNGQPRSVRSYPMARLLDVIREQCRLTGTKEGCGEGECGACAVFLNGELVNSCLVPIVQVRGSQVATIEGVAGEGLLHRIQDCFLQCGGTQCGICTPGMIMASLELLRQNPDPTPDEIREGLSGNLCRCTGYIKIIESILQACRPVGGSK